MERSQPVADSTVFFAHSLAGSSATVGFLSLSDIARALEHALQQSQPRYCAADAEQYADLFIRAAEDIRRLLHQFAAGFLKEADADLLAQLLAIDFSASEGERESVTDSVRASIDAKALAEPKTHPESLVEPEVLEATDSDFLMNLAQPSELPVLPELSTAPVLTAVAAVTSVAAVLAMPAVAHLAAVPRQKVIPASVIPSLTTPTFSEEGDDEIDAVDAIDAELFPIFDEEAAELMPQLGGALRQWSARPDNLSARMEVLRALHTLKGSARLAGALRLGEMAHRIESEIEFLGTDAAATQDFDPLLNRFDAMQHTLDALRKQPQWLKLQSLRVLLPRLLSSLPRKQWQSSLRIRLPLPQKPNPHQRQRPKKLLAKA